MSLGNFCTYIKALIFIVTISSFSVPITSGQTLSRLSLKIEGMVIDSNSQLPLSYVTIALQDKQTKQTVTHILTSENGVFEFTNLAARPYLLTLSYVGYKTKTITLPAFTSNTLNLGKIALSPTATELKEVHVTTQRPLIEQEADKITYNAEADPEQHSLHTLDMLRKVPHILVDADDNLLLNGKDNYQILVNGKRSSLISGNPKDAFIHLPASSVKKIEVITTPSARYEAEGIGGIINIITHKKSISGYNGTINANGNSATGYNAGGNISATIGKFGASGSYRNNYTYSPTNYSKLYREDLIKQNTLEQTTESNNSNRSHYINTEISYQPNAQHSLTANYNWYQNSYNNNYQQKVRQISEDDLLIEAYNNLSTGVSDGLGYDASMGYQVSSAKKEQQLLSVLFNLANNTNNSANNYSLQPVYNYKANESLTLNYNTGREYTVQTDYVQPLGKQVLELGIRSVWEDNSNDYLYQNKDHETGTYKPDSVLSNNFGFKQTIHAAYISLNLKYENWGLRSGVRVESTKLNAAFISSGTKARQTYHNTFPSTTFSRVFKNSSTLKLSYSQRIERPHLYYLDPFVDVTDPLNIYFGNPDLKPATSHTFQLDYDTFFGSSFLATGVSHSFTHNTIQQYTTLGTDSVARTTFANMGSSHNTGFTLSGNTILFKKLTINLNSGTNYVQYTSPFEGIFQRNKGFTYYLQANTAYRFGKTWRASGNIGYNSPNILLQGKSGGYTWSSLSINKDFLKNNKVNLSLSIRSPLQKTRRTTNETVSPTFYQLRESYTVTRQFSLSLNYRFGKLN